MREAAAMLSGVKALAFDTGGTILDWHSGVRNALAQAGERRGVAKDWAALANDYRRRSLQAMLNAGADGTPPDYNIDDVHRQQLEALAAAHGLGGFTADDREAIWRVWHELDCWPGFVDALARLRRKYVCASFTILSTSLIVDVARRNGFSWDAVISCEMIGTYKVHPRAYRTAARWLALKPDEIVMVACHNFDLDAARAEGFRTAFVRRPEEWGPAGPPDPKPNPACDIVVDDFGALAEAMDA
jgi:2-haloacid dehalogenase